MIGQEQCLELLQIIVVIRRWDGVAFGNVAGSNLFNLLGILGIAAVIYPIGVPPTFFKFQYPVLFIFTLGLLPLVRSGAGIVRWEGVLLLSGYVAYVAALYLFPQFM